MADKPYLPILIVNRVRIRDLSDYNLIFNKEIYERFTGLQLEPEGDDAINGRHMIRHKVTGTFYTPVVEDGQVVLQSYLEHIERYVVFIPIKLVDCGDSYYGLFELGLSTQPSEPLGIELLNGLKNFPEPKKVVNVNLSVSSSAHFINANPTVKKVEPVIVETKGEKPVSSDIEIDIDGINETTPVGNYVIKGKGDKKIYVKVLSTGCHELSLPPKLS